MAFTSVSTEEHWKGHRYDSSLSRTYGKCKVGFIYLFILIMSFFCISDVKTERGVVKHFANF